MNGEESTDLHGGERAKTAGNTGPDSIVAPDTGEVTSRDCDVQRIVLFSEIAGGATEVIVEHEGQRYRLRATRNGRLLLNK